MTLSVRDVHVAHDKDVRLFEMTGATASGALGAREDDARERQQGTRDGGVRCVVVRIHAPPRFGGVGTSAQESSLAKEERFERRTKTIR